MDSAQTLDAHRTAAAEALARAGSDQRARAEREGLEAAANGFSASPAAKRLAPAPLPESDPQRRPPHSRKPLAIAVALACFAGGVAAGHFAAGPQKPAAAANPPVFQLDYRLSAGP